MGILESFREIHMTCQLCKKKKPNLIKIFYRDKGMEESTQIDVCSDCEGEMERPFVVYVKSRIARSFISSVKSKGGFVKDTVVQLMEDFVLGK